MEDLQPFAETIRKVILWEEEVLIFLYRYPFPIDCESVPENLKETFPNYQDYLNDLMSYTYTMLGNGPVYTLKIARLDMDNSAIVKNIMQGAYRFISHIC